MMQELYAVIPGAESFYIKGNNIGILISHGFNGTPQSVRYIGEELAKYGFTVLAPRLKGHGTHVYDMENSIHEEWFESLERGYFELKKHCESIFVIGQSMGGTLSLWLAKKYKDINGIITINPALSLPAYENLKGKSYPKFVEEGEPDIKAKNVSEITYEKVPIKSIHELQKLMELTPSILSEINCSILGIKSINDHVVPHKNTDFVLNTICSTKKELVILHNSFHVASMDHDKDLIIKYSNLFIKKQLGKSVA
jgi:carboxylesterase